MLGFKDIAKIFEEIELRLIRSLKRNLGRHKQEEQEYGFEWSAWQAEKLRNVDKFRQECTAIMNEYTDVIDSETRQLMEEQFSEGVNGVDVPAVEPIPDTPAVITPEPHFFGVDRTKVNKLIEDMSYLEKNAETAALRMTDDIYRQTLNRVQLAMSTGSMTLQQAIDMSVKDFLDKGINCIVYSDGRRINIADYVRMALRTTATRAALQGKSAKFKALGYDTVQVSSYGMCSKTCAPWQGRIYIEDTFSMWDGEVRDMGGILWGKSNYCGKWFPLLSSAIEKGLFHPNCRHSIGLWRDGDPLPESIDNTDNERRYKLEQKQRRLENEVRKAKRKVAGLSDPENIKKAKAELRDAQKKLKDFIDKVNADEGVTVLKRDYGREKVYDGEVTKMAAPVSSVSNSNVTKGKAVEINIDAPETPQGAYTDVPVPKPDEPNLAKQLESFNVDIVPSTTEITPDSLEEELNKSEVGREALQYIKDTEIRPKLNYEPQYHTNRGQQFGNSIEIYIDNIPTPLIAAQTVIHEITHHKYGIAKCQWAEAVCMAKEKMHKENRTYLTIAEKRYIIKLAKDNYSDLKWKKGGTRYGKPL